MYVVRRSFRNYNQMLVPGTVVEPDSIKHFKTRLRDRYVIVVSEADFDKWNEYFKKKFGTTIKRAGQNDAGQNDAGQNDAGQNDASQVEPVKAVTPKVVVKVG